VFLYKFQQHLAVAAKITTNVKGGATWGVRVECASNYVRKKEGNKQTNKQRKRSLFNIQETILHNQ